MGTAGHGHCALATSVLWDLDPRSLPDSWHSQDTAFWFSETPCLQAIRLWAVKNDMAVSSDLHICTHRHMYSHTQMHAPYTNTHQKVGRRNTEKNNLCKKAQRNRDVWREKYVGVAGGGWGWSHGCGCHSSNVRFMFCGPPEFSYAKVGSISLA